MLNNVMHQVNQVFSHQALQPEVNWDDDFSGMTELEALIKVKDSLSTINLLQKASLKDNVQYILDLDEKTYRKLQNITHNYLTSVKGNKKLRTMIEVAVFEYLRQLYAVYTWVVSDCQYQNQLNFDVERINLILARYLNTIFMMSKWNYFDGRPAPLGTWSNVHSAIKEAENLSVVNKNLFLYNFQKKEISIATILERGFMLDTLQKESYTPLQLELADRVLKTWSSNPVISKEFHKDEYQFFIHLDEDNKPQRLRNAKQHPNFRYWKTAATVDLIETYLCAVDTRKSLDEFNLVTMAATEDIVNLFKKLRVDWCVKGYKRQRRKEQRVAKQNVIRVSLGIDQICAMNKKSVQINTNLTVSETQHYDSSLTLAKGNTLKQPSGNQFDLSGLQRWTMLEESDSGFSVELDEGMSILIRAGSLVGYNAIGNKSRIAVAEIKNVKKNKNGTYRVGLNKVASSVIATKLSRVQKNYKQEATPDYYVDDGEGNLTFSTEFAGLLVNDDIAGKLRVITPQMQYKRAQRYQVNMYGENHVVLAGEVVKRNRDWVCFEIIA
ncbi:MAG: hypothetical protein ACKE5M_00540 [Methylophilaceae bacterium]